MFYARFDMIVTTLLDETYQRSDQVYRNWTRAIAAVFAIVLALAGGVMLHTPVSSFLAGYRQIRVSGLVGHALWRPIAKDLFHRPGDCREHAATGKKVGCQSRPKEWPK